MGEERKTLGVVCKAGGKGINLVFFMNEIKSERIKEQMRTVTLFISAALLLILGFFIDDKNSKFILLTIGTALFIGMFIARTFKGSFGYKATIEEIEEK